MTVVDGYSAGSNSSHGRSKDEQRDRTSVLLTWAATGLSLLAIAIPVVLILGAILAVTAVLYAMSALRNAEHVDRARFHAKANLIAACIALMLVPLSRVMSVVFGTA